MFQTIVEVNIEKEKITLASPRLKHSRMHQNRLGNGFELQIDVRFLFNTKISGTFPKTFRHTILNLIFYTYT